MEPLHDRLLIKPMEEEEVRRAAAAAARLSLAQKPHNRNPTQINPEHPTLLRIYTHKKTAAGILLPKGPPKPNSDAHFGTVMAVGEDVKIDVKAGQTVVFNKYAMAEVELADGEVIFVSEKSVLGVAE
jgi:chaperonin GroES